MSRGAVEVIREGFELWGAAVSEGDEAAFQQMLSHYAPDAFIDFSRTTPDFPAARGREAMAANVEASRGYFAEARVEPGEFIGDGDVVVVPVRFEARGVSSGVTVEMKFVYAFRVSEGLVVSAQTFMSLPEALNAMGLAN